MSGRELTSLTERNALVKCISFNKRALVLEIGSYDGVTARYLADYATHVYCIDPFIEDPTAPITPSIYNWIANKTENMTLLYGTNRNILPMISDKICFDLVFVDGSHTYEDCLYDIRNAWPLTKMGGFIAIHDYQCGWPGVDKAIDKGFGNKARIIVDRLAIFQT